ncbi:fungal-specific transcription factor domain-containing protein [Xylogone sp. PMI_703]|nr:fungal-specific transcription factor domain-containing protein [Xylogone sp. PMI_703]
MAETQTVLQTLPATISDDQEQSNTDNNTVEPSLPSNRACNECNRKKTKCDRRRPICGLCHRTGISCTYPLRRKQPTISQVRVGSKAQKLRSNIDRLLQLLESNPGALTRPHNSTSGVPADTITVEAPQTHREDYDIPESSPNESNDLILEDEIHSLRQLNSTMANIDWDEVSTVPVQVGNGDTPNIEGQHHSSDYNTFELTYSLVCHLVELYFDKVQPWLPLLHKPSFQNFLAERLDHSSSPLRNLRDDEMIVMYGLFSLSARFSSSPEFADVDPLERGARFFIKAQHHYNRARELTDANMTYLQGCILMSCYMYTSAPCSQGWILIGVCVRLAYELGLSDMDDENSEQQQPSDWIRQEEMRRAWWLVWELDTFCSAIRKQPFSIDRRRMAVKLPVSDDAWFAGEEKSSGKLLARPGQCWASLQGCENQCERAWFLITNHMMSAIQDLMLGKGGITLDEKVSVENEISCLRLALPPIFNIEIDSPAFQEAPFSKINWILGARLMLMSASAMARTIIPPSADMADTSGVMRFFMFEFSRIVSRWPAGYVSLAHPFFACMVLPNSVVASHAASEELTASTQNLADMVLSHLGTKWKIAKTVLRLAKLLRQPGELSPNEYEACKQFPALLPSKIGSPNRMSTAVIESDQECRNNTQQTQELPISHEYESHESIDQVFVDNTHTLPINDQENRILLGQPVDQVSLKLQIAHPNQLEQNYNVTFPQIYHFEDWSI